MVERKRIRILQPGDEAALEAFLLPRVASSMFLLGNMRTAGLMGRGEPYQGTYAAAFEDGEIKGVVAHYWNDKLIFQAPVCVNALWRRAVEASGRPVGGLIGPNAQVRVAKEALDVPESSVQLDETERLYALELDELVIPEILASGEVVGRRAERGDLELLTAWRAVYGQEALGEPVTAESRDRARAATLRLIEERRTWILVTQAGQPMGCSSFNTATEEAVQVGGVWTPPELRSRGYGRAVVAASLIDARMEGVTTAILFTGQQNIAAQKAYEALGFEHVGAYRMLLLSTPLDKDDLASGDAQAE